MWMAEELRELLHQPGSPVFLIYLNASLFITESFIFSVSFMCRPYFWPEQDPFQYKLSPLQDISVFPAAWMVSDPEIRITFSGECTLKHCIMDILLTFNYIVIICKQSLVVIGAFFSLIFTIGNIAIRSIFRSCHFYPGKQNLPEEDIRTERYNSQRPG